MTDIKRIKLELSALSSSSRWRMTAAFAAVALASGALSMALGRNVSIWFDEGYSIMISRRPVLELIHLTSVDAHPPLYYLLLKAWGEIFAWREPMLRLLSSIFAGLAAAVMLLLIRQLASERIALASIPFLIIAPYHLRFGYEIRMYSLASLIVVTATLLFVRALRTRRQRLWIAYAVLVALGMYTLFVTAMVWISQLAVLVYYAARHRASWKSLYAYPLAIVCYIPYLPLAIRQLLNPFLNPYLGQGESLAGLSDTLSLFVLGRSGAAIGVIQTFLCFAELGMFAWFVVRLRDIDDSCAARDSKESNDSDGSQGNGEAELVHARRASVELFLMLAMPLAVFFLVDATRQIVGAAPMYIPRYASFVSISFYAMIAVACAAVLLNANPRKRLVALMAYVCIVAINVVATAHVAVDGNVDAGGQRVPISRAERAAVDCSPDVTVLATEAFLYVESSYYFDGCTMKFLGKKDVSPYGGFAPLRGSPARISDISQLDTPTVIVLTWTATRAPLDDPRYRLVSEQAFSKQKVVVYELR
ncbi:MAG: glycosyltransferase family 39 protein [Bifidobacterium sp.]|jgi:uncharacterized membrane protein|nr:glycosyltransferase family 39 protein [Bifidobacterium sp.]